MESRAATRADLPAIADLHRRYDTGWFGAPESDESEVAESFNRVDPLAERSRVVFEDDRLVAAAYWWSTEAILLIDPAVTSEQLHHDLIAWYAAQPVEHVDVLEQDAPLRAALSARGWRHERSAFELLRSVGPDWELAAPAWPVGVRIRGLRSDDAARLHQLIYREAGWAEVPGHHERGFEEWQSFFLTPQELPEQQVLAWRDERLVGAVLGRTFSNGTGWVSQLAVAKPERGKGLARALLLEAYRRRRDAGAHSLGLGVMAANRAALALYLGIGLRIDREWMAYAHP